VVYSMRGLLAVAGRDMHITDGQTTI
jgi:hypothetical protein